MLVSKPEIPNENDKMMHVVPETMVSISDWSQFVLYEIYATKNINMNEHVTEKAVKKFNIFEHRFMSSRLPRSAALGSI